MPFMIPSHFHQAQLVRRGLFSSLLIFCAAACGEPTEAPAPVETLKTKGAPSIPVRAFALGSPASAAADLIQTSGTLRPSQNSTLAFVVGGVVASVDADEGDEVSSGTVLASLDPVPFRAATADAVSRVQFLAARLRRSQQLASSGAIAAEESESDLSNHASAEAALDLAEWNLSRSRIRAPFSGTIVARQTEPGEVVGPGTPAFELISTNPLELAVSVAAKDLPRIGGQIRVDSRDFPDLDLVAEIHHFPVSADPRSSTVPLLLRIENPDRRLLPGTIATASIPLEPISNSGATARMRVPISTIRATSSGPVVFRIEKGRAKAFPVEVGEVRGEFVSIQSDLRSGDLIVLEAPDRLRAGDALVVVGDQ